MQPDARLRSPPAQRSSRDVDLISDALPFSWLWYGEPNAVGNAKFYSRSHDTVIRLYDKAGNVIETHEHKGEFKET
jgi:anti-sigma factor ChrR (cupin superfamily)